MARRSAGYSGTPLIRKLGIKSGFKVGFIDPPQDYAELLGPLPDGTMVTDPRRETGFDFIHLFADRVAAVERRLSTLRPRMVPNGMIWVSWPKRTSGVATDLDENVVRGIGLANGLVDVKVCAVDEVWSALKFVIRRRDR